MYAQTCIFIPDVFIFKQSPTAFQLLHIKQMLKTRTTIAAIAPFIILSPQPGIVVYFTQRNLFSGKCTFLFFSPSPIESGNGTRWTMQYIVMLFPSCHPKKVH